MIELQTVGIAIPLRKRSRRILMVCIRSKPEAVRGEDGRTADVGGKPGKRRRAPLIFKPSHSPQKFG